MAILNERYRLISTLILRCYSEIAHPLGERGWQTLRWTLQLRMKKNGDSWIWKAIDATITFRFIIVSFGLILIFSFRWPVAFLAVLVLALAFCVYRIVKDRRASKVKRAR